MFGHVTSQRTRKKWEEGVGSGGIGTDWQRPKGSK